MEGNGTSADEASAAMRVLVVEDDEDIRVVVRYALEAEVVEAADGYEGMRQLVGGEPFDVVVLDVMMPAMSGLDLLDQIRGSARFAEVPVVMLTALGRESDYSAAFRAGADAYVTKPFDPADLRGAIDTVLARSPELRAARRDCEQTGPELLS